MTTPYEVGRNIGSSFGEAFGSVRKEQRENSALDEILGNALNSEDPTELVRAKMKIIQNVSPEKRPAAIGILENQEKKLVAAKSQKAQFNLANAIQEANPNSQFHSMVADIYRADLPIEEKNKLIKNLSSTASYRDSQQERLVLDSVLKRYNSRIKEMDAQIKTSRLSERKVLEDQRKGLQDERDQLLDFKALRSKKIKFDQNNPEHRAKAEEIFEITKDKNKVKEQLSEEFEF